MGVTTETAVGIAMGDPAIGEEEIEAVARVLRSGKLREGEVTREFERQFARAEGGEWAIACSSGTAALFLAYLAMLRPGEEVLVPGFGFVATASMVVAAGAVPVFCDVDPATFAILPREIEKRAGPRTRACVPVHLFGNPCPIDELELACREKGLRIVWDAAQAHGATYRGRGLGSFPDLACYSFYASKNITTGGEGGMVIGRDEAARTRIQRAKDHGTEGRYRHRSIGYNFRMTEMQSAIGLAQLQKLPGLNEARRRNAARLTRALRDLAGLRVPAETHDATAVWHQYTLVCDLSRLSVDRDGFAARLAARGVASSVHYPLPLNHQPALTEYGKGEELPGCIELSRRVLSIPVHARLTEKEVDRVAEAVRAVHDEVLR